MKISKKKLVQMKISKKNLVQMKITKLIKIFRNCEMALKRTQLEIQIMRIRTETVVEKKSKVF